MIPELIDYPIGGTSEGQGGITQAIAGYLRSKKVNGIIYPSARNDCVVEIRNGRLAGFGGWNFVDYRQSQQAVFANWNIVSPWKQEVLEGIQIQEPQAGEFKGSLRISGVAAANDNNYESSATADRTKLMAQLKSGHPRVILLYGSRNLDELATS